MAAALASSAIDVFVTGFSIEAEGSKAGQDPWVTRLRYCRRVIRQKGER